MMKKKINTSAIINLLLVVIVGVLAFVPDTRAWVGRGLMKIGLFKPDLEHGVVKEEESRPTHTDMRAPVLFADGNGNRIDAANQTGKVVFVNFWATWCPPCIAEMPSIDKLYQRFKDNPQVVFIMADVDGDYEKSKQFMAGRKLGLPVHVPAGKIPDHWLGGAVPTTVILDKQGRIAARHEGMADYSRPEVTAFIQQLLSQ